MKNDGIVFNKFIDLIGGIFCMILFSVLFLTIVITKINGGLVNLYVYFTATSIFILGVCLFMLSGSNLFHVPGIYIAEPKNLAQWSTAVRTRDGYKCAYCDETDCLDAHHLAPKSIFPKLRLNVKNGITVCKSHHYIAADIFRRLQEVLTMEIR